MSADRPAVRVLTTISTIKAGALKICRLNRNTLAVFVLLMFTVLLSACKDKPLPELMLDGEAMGTTWQVTLATANNPDTASLKKEIDALLVSLNTQMSTYNDESALSSFNADVSTGWVDMPEPVVSLVNAARRVSKATQGAFDITMGSVVDLWGFGADDIPENEPTLDVILDEMNSVGYQLLLVSRDETQVRKTVPGLKVDLSSIAKGYAVDRVGELLEGQGLNRYIVEFGGEIRTRGKSAEHTPWTIGIESPDPTVAAKGFLGIAVENAHIATSGDYRNYREVDGKRVSHLIDGRTGYPIENNVASVTVLHGTTEQADAWATAFMVLGADESLARAEDDGLAVSLTVREGNGFVTRNSSAFSAYVRQ